ncbi:MAG: ion channel [Anaerolineales bacterium]|jgi:hypothetical protein
MELAEFSLFVVITLTTIGYEDFHPTTSIT